MAPDHDHDFDDPDRTGTSPTAARTCSTSSPRNSPSAADRGENRTIDEFAARYPEFEAKIRGPRRSPWSRDDGRAGRVAGRRGRRCPSSSASSGSSASWAGAGWGSSTRPSRSRSAAASRSRSSTTSTSTPSARALQRQAGRRPAPHTNIVPIFGAGEHDGLPYYGCRYIPGERPRRPACGPGGGTTAPGRRPLAVRAGLGVQAAEALSTPTSRASFTATSSRRTSCRRPRLDRLGHRLRPREARPARTSYRDRRRDRHLALPRPRGSAA